MDTVTVTVWVTEHDDPDVEYVVNTRSDMEENFSDLLAQVQGTETGAITIQLPGEPDTPVFYDVSELLKAADPTTYDIEFRRYCEGWTRMEMPFDVYFSDDENAPRDWVRENL